MKSFVLFSLVLLSLPAFSELSPEHGDFATYKATRPSSEHEEKRTLEEYDEESDRFKQVIYKTKDGEITVLSEGWETKSFFEFVYVSDLEERCSSQGGEIETLTVPAGTFKTCKTKKTNGGAIRYKWVAEDVPFGMVRSENSSIYNPTRKHIKELISFGTETPEEE